MSFKCLILDESEINELLKFQILVITKTESITIDEEEDKSLEST